MKEFLTRDRLTNTILYFPLINRLPVIQDGAFDFRLQVDNRRLTAQPTCPTGLASRAIRIYLALVHFSDIAEVYKFTGAHTGTAITTKAKLHCAPSRATIANRCTAVITRFRSLDDAIATDRVSGRWRGRRGRVFDHTHIAAAITSRCTTVITCFWSFHDAIATDGVGGR
jgi:hypothetical protein